MNELQKTTNDIRAKLMPVLPTKATPVGGGSAARSQRISMSMQTYRYVLLLTALFSLYYLFLASDRFATESQVFVTSTSPQIPTTLATPLIMPSSPGLQDAYQLKEFILSADMLDLLEEELDVRFHYASRDWDWLSRLSSDASQEDLLKFYREHTSVVIDPNAASVSIETQGFNKAFSESINKAIIKKAERFINDISREVARQEVSFVEKQLDEKKQQLETATANLRRFQIEEGVIDSGAVIQAVQAAIIQIDATLVEKRSSLKTMQRFMSEDAPQVVSIKGEIAALEQEKKELTENRVKGGSDNIAAAAVDQKRLELQVEFAADLYQRALGSLEQKQIEASQKGKYLTIVQSPRLAESAKYPRRLYNIATFFVILSIAYAVGIMIIATVQEHRDV